MESRANHYIGGRLSTRVLRFAKYCHYYHWWMECGPYQGSNALRISNSPPDFLPRGEPMKPPNWDRLQEIYHSALALPRHERDAFVALECAGDLDLQHQVESLLEADDLDNILESPVIELEPAIDDLVGRTIAGRYVVEKALSPGGMSRVYLARDRNLIGQAVVVKVLSQELAHHPHVRQKFEDEVRALLDLRHSGVVRAHDKGKLPDGRPYIVMEYIEGDTLRLHIRPEGMDLKRVASILKQIGPALDDVHAAGIVHRDLKPENILLRHGSNEVVLVDFGIAKVPGSLTTTHSPIGTLLYMSPEQLSGEEITAASDVYSIAVVAYEMITGRRPFNATSAPQIVGMQRGGVRVRPTHLRENLPRKAQTILLRALSFDPKSRQSTAKRFCDELADALLEVPVAVPPTRWLKFIAAGLGIALVSVLIYKAITRPEPPPPFSPNSFTYFLTVQKMRDGKEYQEPYKSNGDKVIFESGDKFRLTVLTPKSAYVYIINEGPPETNDTNVTMIYPSRAINNGSATVGANQSIQSDWLTFRGPEGDDNFWIVWSVSPVTQLESAKNEAFNHPRGGLTERTWIQVKEFLKVKQSEVDVTVYHYKKTQEAVPRGKGNTLVTLAQFNHR
jgi:serine/threonine protein kinase